ncbi:MAG: hypothetical protein Q7R34_05940 [Dehalococcoidia bacterium]|nr:hypothetical protein [Dehalococcoidia bacterium]
MAIHKLTFPELAKPRPESFSILGPHSVLYALHKASNRHFVGTGGFEPARWGGQVKNLTLRQPGIWLFSGQLQCKDLKEHRTVVTRQFAIC